MIPGSKSRLTLVFYCIRKSAILEEYVDNICRREQARYGLPGIPLGNGTRCGTDSWTLGYQHAIELQPLRAVCSNERLEYRMQNVGKLQFPHVTQINKARQRNVQCKTVLSIYLVYLPHKGVELELLSQNQQRTKCERDVNG